MTDEQWCEWCGDLGAAGGSGHEDCLASESLDGTHKVKVVGGPPLEPPDLAMSA